MKIGLFVYETADSVDPAVLAKKAEELGFESFWVPEHSIIPVRYTTPFRGTPDGSIPESYKRTADPFISLARASAVTSTIKLGTAICLVPERSPLLLAKEIATLDHFSGGRFIFGIGAGWLKEETEIMGGDFSHRWTQTREAVLAMKELWTKDEAEFHGSYFDFPPVVCRPKPAQAPHPPILLGGDGWAPSRLNVDGVEVTRGRASNVFKRVVEWGDGWMPSGMTVDDIREGRATLNRLAEQAGRDPGSIKIMAFGSGTEFGGPQYRDRQSAMELEEAGADRVSIWLDNHTEETQAFEEMERIAQQLL